MIEISNDNWQTPRDLFDKLNEEFKFHLDAACSGKDCLCPFGIDVRYGSSLDVDWLDYASSSVILHEKPRTNLMSTWIPNPTIWLNPPYSKPNLELFTKKAYEESQKGCIVVGLIPLVCSPKWYDKYVFGKAHEIRFLSKRVRFIDPETGKKGGSPAFDSIIVVWKPGIPTETKFSMFEW